MKDRLRTVLIAAPMVALVIATAAVLSPATGGAQSTLSGCDAVAQGVGETGEARPGSTPNDNSETRYKQTALAAAAEAEAACAAATTTTTRPATTTTLPATTTTTRPATTTTLPATTTTR